VSHHQPAVALAECDESALDPLDGGPRRPASGYVVFVGVGMGGPLQLTLAAVKVIAEADVLVCNPGVDEGLLSEPEVTVRPRTLVLTADERPDLEKVAGFAKSGSTVVWLVTGDPLVDGEAAPLAAALRDLGCSIDMVPGLARATLATTLAGVQLGPESLLSSAPGAVHANQSVVALVTTDQLEELTDRALGSGWSPEEPTLLTLGYASRAQRSIETTLAHLPEAAADADDSNAAVVIGPAAHRDPALNWFESKPLFGWRVLVPRTKGLSGVLERRLEQHGATPVQVPTISVEPPRNPQPMERAIQGLVDGRFQWIIFNSANAVRAVTERLAAFGLDARAFSGLRIASVGSQTRYALKSWGIIPDLVPEGEQRSEALAAEFPAFDEVLDPINRIFLPRADIAVEALASSLNELGWEVEDVTAYRTVRAAPPPADVREGIKGGRFDAVVFSSASTVRNMVGIAGKPHPDTIIAAIGPATVAACEEHGLRVDAVSERPGMIDLVDALADFAAHRRDDLVARGEPVRRPSQRRARRHK